ncbi:hypothetical protein M430DRAFT_192859 [Amorphotheca resinae ATCC 22711]|uniref:F-box domain-containing protein n=1 Tax=Amorphotheca resinae ATCC 22711 TaxID=857342 RepID=A0A2T3AQ25_AMORE|nr:hypothetical protein M430DRAFT_192859 [Amorphotheca resinae ATCC 22711]PSS07107.1 hypothetical protein M430DRAFT_192859 [Amorphotheca resinae ATCC 22711]
MDPLHITEFASERYFSKLRQLNENAENAANASSSTGPAVAPNAPLPPSSQQPTFTLPLGNPRQRQVENETIPLRTSDQKKRSLGHDLTSLRTQRRPSFSGSFGSLRSKVSVIHKTPSIAEQHEQVLAEEDRPSQALTLADLFLALPNELQEHIIAPLPIHDILSLRLVSKSFHGLVALNESPIARYHVAHSLPPYALRLYPVPNRTDINLHYLCSIWHRLHVSSKLSAMIARQAVKEIFLRTTPAQLKEFEPQHRRMRQRLMPLVFTLFHFFETYRDLHVRHLLANGTPLNQQAFVLNPIECQIMAMYDDQTLLKVHQAWTLIISSFSRRLRPPSYAGRIERSIKGYLKDRPPDEVYTTILMIGGLRQAQRFWETKRYNIRRAAVDTWYSLVTRSPVEPTPKSKMSLITHLGRKKATPAPEATSAEGAGHDATSCNEWFCVKPTCQAARRRHSTDNLVFHSSLAAGPPMSPLPRDQLQLLLPDLQHLANIWIHTAEALILERKIVERPQDIKRNTQVLLELIRDDGTDGIGEWSSGNPRTQHMDAQEASGDVSD